MRNKLIYHSVCNISCSLIISVFLICFVSRPWSSKEEVKEGFLISLDYVTKHNLTFFQGYFSLI